MTECTFGEAERSVKCLFACGREFRFRNQNLVVEFAEKPTCAEGEPKCDIFVRCKNEESKVVDLKISYKKNNADFLENKIKAERAAEIFGMNWMSIISGATKSIRNEFVGRTLVYKRPESRTEAGAITLGWKFEFVNRKSGELSGVIPLSIEAKCNIFSGRNLSPDKRNAYIQGVVVQDSGVADLMLVADPINDLQKMVNELVDVQEFAAKSEVYFACKALNYRTLHNPPKWDGDRPLAVQVDWNVREGVLTPSFDFEHPLVRKGNEMGEKLRKAMQKIGVVNTAYLNASNCACL